MTTIFEFLAGRIVRLTFLFVVRCLVKYSGEAFLKNITNHWFRYTMCAVVTNRGAFNEQER